MPEGKKTDTGWDIPFEKFFVALDATLSGGGTYDALVQAVMMHTKDLPENKGRPSSNCTKKKVYSKLAYVRKKWNLTITLKSSEKTGMASELDEQKDKWMAQLLTHENVSQK